MDRKGSRFFDWLCNAFLLNEDTLVYLLGGIFVSCYKTPLVQAYLGWALGAVGMAIAVSFLVKNRKKDQKGKKKAPSKRSGIGWVCLGILLGLLLSILMGVSMSTGWLAGILTIVGACLLADFASWR